MNVLAQEFFELFKGLDYAHGKAVLGKPNPKKGGKVEADCSTVTAPYVAELWEKHLSGEQGLGVIPILPDATCHWGAIDIDVYDGLDFKSLEQQIKCLPLVLCTTKSGGAHLYIFFEEATSAEYVRGKLIDWAIQLGFPAVEIYPKQTKLAVTKGKVRDVGNWINMPYFDVDGKNHKRYALLDGKKLTAGEFVVYAHEKKATQEVMELSKIATSAGDDDWHDGPPCLQALAAQGIPEGGRNNTLLNMGVYARLKYGDDWKDKFEEFNHSHLQPPLKMAECSALMKSLNKKDYFYTCNKTPCSQFCNKEVCKTRQYGVGGNEDAPTIDIGELTKIDSKPPTWILEVGGARLQINSTADLLNQDKLRILCVEAINVLPNKMKAATYERLIKERLSNVTIVEAPPDSGPEGRLWDLLEQFCTGRAQALEKDELLKGMPWTDNGLTYFRSRDLMKYLDQQHFRDFKEREVWSKLRERDAKHGQFNVKGTCCQWWAVAEFKKQDEDFKTHTLEEL